MEFKSEGAAHTWRQNGARWRMVSGTESSNGGFVFAGFKRTGGIVVQLHADDYGNGVVGAYNRKGQGRELKPGS